jgi:hypothetical protein
VRGETLTYCVGSWRSSPDGADPAATSSVEVHFGEELVWVLRPVCVSKNSNKLPILYRRYDLFKTNETAGGSHCRPRSSS